MTEESESSMTANVDEVESPEQSAAAGADERPSITGESNGSGAGPEVPVGADDASVGASVSAEDSDFDYADRGAVAGQDDGEAAGDHGGERSGHRGEADDEADDHADDDRADDDRADDDRDGDDFPEESDSERFARLEREGDVAADYLEELLDIADLDGDIDLDIEGERALVAIVGGRLNKLVGRDGEVLEALQELARLAVLRETGSRSRLMLDIGGHRARRRGELVDLAEKIAEQVKETGKPVKLDPMSPFERKIVHDAVAAKGLTSESEGEEPDRRVVVQPA